MSLLQAHFFIKLGGDNFDRKFGINTYGFYFVIFTLCFNR